MRAYSARVHECLRSSYQFPYQSGRFDKCCISGDGGEEGRKAAAACHTSLILQRQSARLETVGKREMRERHGEGDGGQMRKRRGRGVRGEVREKERGGERWRPTPALSARRLIYRLSNAHWRTNLRVPRSHSLSYPRLIRMVSGWRWSTHLATRHAPSPRPSHPHSSLVLPISPHRPNTRVDMTDDCRCESNPDWCDVTEWANGYAEMICFDSSEISSRSLCKLDKFVYAFHFGGSCVVHLAVQNTAVMGEWLSVLSCRLLEWKPSFRGLIKTGGESWVLTSSNTHDIWQHHVFIILIQFCFVHFPCRLFTSINLFTYPLVSSVSLSLSSLFSPFPQ